MEDIKAFPDLKNFRDLCCYRTNSGAGLNRGVFARSDNPYRITPAETEKLRSLGFTSVIDLRRKDEIGLRPDLLASAEGFTYHSVVMNEGRYITYCDTTVPPGAAKAYFDFLGMYRDRVAEIFRLLSAAECGIMFHCESGKDRTGVIAALLLQLCDVCEEDIIEDYRLSYDRMYLGGEEELLCDPTLIPCAETMELFLSFMGKKYGKSEDYLLSAGLKDKEISKIREKFIK